MKNVAFIPNSAMCQTGLCCSETCSELLGLPDTTELRFGLVFVGGVFFPLKGKKKF